MKCITCLARVDDETDINDVEIKSNVADVFMFFLPGIVLGLKTIILEDEKTGHEVITVIYKKPTQHHKLLLFICRYHF